MKHILFFFLFCFAFLALKAQYTISGFVRDAESNEALVGAVVAAPEQETGTYTNRYGFYSLSLKADTVQLRIDYSGYGRQIHRFALKKDSTLNIELSVKEVSLDEVLITDQRARENVERATMGQIDINIEEVEQLPFIAGEKDLLKGIQLLPGVQSGSEASAGFFVRGGRPDQNLILMDEAIVYNPFHLAGYVSIFNTDAIRNVTLQKGSFPANFGGRLSSILEIDMKEGNMRKFHGEGGIGLISSRIMLEGPIIKDKVSFMVSARRFYWDLLVQPFLPKGQSFGYNFQDFNAKLNWRISDKDRIYISGYYGRDVLYNETEIVGEDTTKFNVNWGNKTFTARWNHLFSNKLFANTTFVYSDYDYEVKQTFGKDNLTLFSGIEDINGKIDFDYYPNPRHKIKFGLNYIYHTFTPSSTRFQSDNIDSTLNTEQIRYVHEAAAYINDEISVNEKVGINIGVRVPYFVWKDLEYRGIEPRITFKYSLNQNASIKGGYTWMNQYVHLVTSSTISLPFDIWTPSSREVKPQIAHQGAVGYFQNFLNDRYETSVEIYYKHMQNQIDFREGANFFFSDNLERELVFGQGWSYGAEFYIRKRAGRLTGWLAYTLAWSWRQFDDLNFGNKFPAKYDRRHDLSLVCVYKFNKKWSFSSVFVYGSGHWLTFPNGSIYIPLYGWTNNWSWFDEYTSKNNQRLRPYHRLDIGLRYKVEKERWTYSWHIDLYNSYNRRNPFFVYLNQEFDPRANAHRFVGRQVSLLPLIPSISWVFKF